MKKFSVGDKILRTLNAPLSASAVALLDRTPWAAVSVAAFFALAEFGLWPVVVLIPTLRHHSFDRMVDWNMELLDKGLFPLVAWLSVAVYAFSLAKALREKRSLSALARRNPTLWLFLTLVVWMTANIWLTNGMMYSVRHGAGLKHESFFLHLEYFLCFFPIGFFLRDSRLKLWLLRGLTAVSVVLASCAFYLYKNLHASAYYYDWAPSYAGIFTNINYYAYFLTVFIGVSAALFACAKSKGWRVFYAVALVMNTVVLVYNNTFGAWIGAFCACLFLVAARRVMDGKFTFWPLAALALFLVALCLTGALKGSLVKNVKRLSTDVEAVLTQPDSQRANYAGSKRWGVWKKCAELILQNPLVGIGYEGIHVRGLAYVGNPRPHNEFMQYALFYGIPGGLLYIASCAGVYIRAFRRRARLGSLTLVALTAAFGYLAGSFFGLTVYNTAPYLFIMLGLGYAWTEEDSASATRSVSAADGASATQSVSATDETE